MAERRMISKVISISEKVNSLTLFGRLLYTWMIPHADDFGRLPGSPAKIRALVVPMCDETVKDVEQALQDMHEKKLIIWYEVNGEKFIQINNFEEHQQGLHKRTKSKFPEPPNTFPEIPGNSEKFPLEGNGIGTEGKGTEGKGTESPPPDESLKDRVAALIKDCEIDGATLYHMDILYSYLGVVDIEVIEAAIKKGQKKHVNYAINTLEGWVKEGKTTKESIHQPVQTNVQTKQPKGGAPPVAGPHVPGVEETRKYLEELEQLRLEKQRRLGRAANTS